VAILARVASCGSAAGEATFGIGEPVADAEGRTITVDIGGVALVAAYVPNAGEGLRRLEYRVGTWETAMVSYLQRLQAGGRAVLYTGDLNVAHADADFFNPEEKRMLKQAGTTPQEREAFGRMLEEATLVDLFRAAHPEARHVYSYWSMRARNRPWNRGLRLDYTLGSSALWRADAAPAALDAFVLDDVLGSDHAPVGVDLLLLEQ